MKTKLPVCFELGTRGDTWWMCIFWERGNVCALPAARRPAINAQSFTMASLFLVMWRGHRNKKHRDPKIVSKDLRKLYNNQAKIRLCGTDLPQSFLGSLGLHEGWPPDLKKHQGTFCADEYVRACWASVGSEVRMRKDKNSHLLDTSSICLIGIDLLWSQRNLKKKIREEMCMWSRTPLHAHKASSSRAALLTAVYTVSVRIAVLARYQGNQCQAKPQRQHCASVFQMI